MIVKEFCCGYHGYFEGSHPICPHLGCESDFVERVFLTPPGITSERTKNTDAGFRAIAQDYGLTDMNNRGGKAVIEANPHSAIWGHEGVKDYQGMLQQAGTPTVIHDKQGREHVADQMGMRAAAKAFGIDQTPLPPAERRYHKEDMADWSKVMK